MLEKDPGSPKITQLQIIVIVEGNMNTIMKVIWNRRLVPVAEKTAALSSLAIAKVALHWMYFSSK
eukprot:4440484-Ditylum_brightwellii.AAC.1